MIELSGLRTLNVPSGANRREIYLRLSVLEVRSQIQNRLTCTPPATFKISGKIEGF